MKFLLIRHCETDWNREKRLQGHTDIPLSDYGREQALCLAGDLMKQGDIARIISSDLERATETARIIAQHFAAEMPRGLFATEDQRLRECSFGQLEGKTWEEIEREFLVRKTGRAYIYTGDDDPYDFTQFGGERRDDVIRRHVGLLDDVVRRTKSVDRECVLLVGHSTALNTLLSHFDLPTGLRRGEIRELTYP
ncbi:MAG: histidine phosphatase family protein [bacterium]|nr:histidine phosphatase family protein [bacterium]MDZ4284460.1 histidine phosphatase family protein [Patescibacteria group bacterium]